MRGQTRRRPANAESTEGLVVSAAGRQRGLAFVLLFLGVDSGKFQRTQSTLLVVYCQGSERAH